jgi:hypothetical protein
MFERFDQDARGAMVRARAEAILAGQDEIGPEHLLVALAGGTDLAARTLQAAGASAESLRTRLPASGPERLEPLDAAAVASIGIDLDTVSRASDAAFGAGSLTRARPTRLHSRRGRRRRTSGLPLAPAAKRTLDLTTRTAIRRGHNTITPGHMLLGLLDEPASAATAALIAVGVDLQALLVSVRRGMNRGEYSESSGADEVQPGGGRDESGPAEGGRAKGGRASSGDTSGHDPDAGGSAEGRTSDGATDGGGTDGGGTDGGGTDDGGTDD